MVATNWDVKFSTCCFVGGGGRGALCLRALGVVRRRCGKHTALECNKATPGQGNQSVTYTSLTWGFTIISDPNLDTQIVGSPYNQDPNKVPANPHVANPWVPEDTAGYLFSQWHLPHLLQQHQLRHDGYGLQPDGGGPKDLQGCRAPASTRALSLHLPPRQPKRTTS